MQQRNKFYIANKNKIYLITIKYLIGDKYLNVEYKVLIWDKYIITYNRITP